MEPGGGQAPPGQLQLVEELLHCSSERPWLLFFLYAGLPWDPLCHRDLQGEQSSKKGPVRLHGSSQYHSLWVQKDLPLGVSGSHGHDKLLRKHCSTILSKVYWMQGFAVPGAMLPTTFATLELVEVEVEHVEVEGVVAECCTCQCRRCPLHLPAPCPTLG